jgi:hypothetical protein
MDLFVLLILLTLLLFTLIPEADDLNLFDHEDEVISKSN